jgi:Co/Zn/Cd efflux system component
VGCRAPRALDGAPRGLAVRGAVPAAEIIGGVGVLALAANLTCLALLLRHRADDLNLRSTWLCSRNDVLANAAVLVAAGGVALTGAAWPDTLIGAVIAAVFGASAVGVLRDASRQLTLRFPPRAPSGAPHPDPAAPG